MKYNEHKLLMLCFSGSAAYGLSTPKSDVDVRGVFFNNKEELLGFESLNVMDEPPDNKLFSLRKFFELCMKGNSASLELFGLEQHLYKYESEEWRELKEHSGLFLSQRLLLMAKGNEKTQEKEIAKKVEAGDFYRASKYMSHALRIYDFAKRSAETGEFVALSDEQTTKFLMEVKEGSLIVNGKVSSDYHRYLNLYRENCEKAFEKHKVPENCNAEKVQKLLVDLSERGLQY